MTKFVSGYQWTAQSSSDSTAVTRGVGFNTANGTKPVKIVRLVLSH
jgi:hypothetical protein